MQLKLLNALMAIGLAAAGSAGAQVTDKMIQSEATTNGNVLTWGVNTQGQRYSPLKQVTPAPCPGWCRHGPSPSEGRSSAARRRSP